MLSIPLDHPDRLNALLLELKTVYYLHTLEEFGSATPALPDEPFPSGQSNANPYLWDRVGTVLVQMHELVHLPDFGIPIPERLEA
ncbi:MAG: hypothetical protein IJY28_01365 [Clostridia bacterium]|nr:hypothetical protein [Clostridia bacterium]